MKKILSILVPVYNTEKYIKRCLDTIVIDEVIDDIEIIIVSDGSKDKAVEIAKEYSKKYPKSVIVIEKENGGHGSTINKGLEVATGKYFKVLDSDDWFNIIDFVEFVNKLKKEDSDLVVTNYKQVHVYNQTEIEYKYKNLKEGEIYKFDDLDLDLLDGEYFVMATSTYKLDILKKSGLHLLEKTFYVDMIYNIVPVEFVKTITYYDLDIYRYYIGRKDQSVNTSSFVKNQDHHDRVVRWLLDFYDEKVEKYSNNKKKYVDIILKYLLYTHYNIYLVYDNNYKNAAEKIKEFDNYLKKKNIYLYDELGKHGDIKIHRKYNFFFVKHFHVLFKKSYALLRTLRRG